MQFILHLRRLILPLVQCLLLLHVPSVWALANPKSMRQRRLEKRTGGASTLPPPPQQIPQTEAGQSKANQDGSSSLEDLFGLGNEQLRELMEQELPVPREDLITRKQVDKEKLDKNKVFQLPDLAEFMEEDATGADARDKAAADLQREKKVDRSNQEEYLRVLQLNPFADADESMFLDEYDIIPSIFGSGKLLNIPVPYLQTGHGILLAVTLLAALVYAPGNPLTEFPAEVRIFLKQGLMVTYSINMVLAVQAFFKAKSKNLPAVFWAVKCFLLGGVAYYEIMQAKDPLAYSVPVDLSDRKSKRPSR